MLEQLKNVDPDIILIDMEMPVMDGFETIKQLRKSGFHRPVLALTAHAFSDYRSKCMAAGCNGFLSKPIDQATLIHAVHQYTREDRLRYGNHC